MANGNRVTSLYDYRASRDLADTDVPFYALLLAAMRRADDTNAALLREAFPEVWDELWRRYHAPGGFLPGEEDQA